MLFIEGLCMINVENYTVTHYFTITTSQEVMSEITSPYGSLCIPWINTIYIDI